MTTVTSRDLVHKSTKIRRLLAAGKTLRWTSHGVPVALIQPASSSEPKPKPDWISRARAAGCVNTGEFPVADSIYADRG
jgi:antitoxin (DNA-binding transcriptional repressor) of toxin-antitoxin stability system